MRLSRTSPSFLLNQETSLNLVERKLLEPLDRMGNMNQNMFRDDFRSLFTGVSRRNSDTFIVSSNDAKLEEQLLSSFVSRRHYSGRSSTIEEIVEQIAQNLLHHGKAYYFLLDSKNDQRFFRPLPSNTIFSFFGTIIQYVPKRIERNWDRNDDFYGREIKILDRKKVASFYWPKSIKRKIKAQNKILKAIDKYAEDRALKHMVQPTHDNPNPKNQFDFSVWKDAQDNALFTATKLTGWSGRVSSKPQLSDFFICYRLLRFRKLQVELSTYIAKSLAHELTIIGQHEDPNFKLDINLNGKFQNLHELASLERRLNKEEVSFREVLNYCYGIEPVQDTSVRGS